MLELDEIVIDIAAALKRVDQSGIRHKQFQPGVGPFGEAQLVRAIFDDLKKVKPSVYLATSIRRVPDVLVPKFWALEFKIIRPFGDNGLAAEHWSENVLHPYAGNTSSLSDCLKLISWGGPERRAVVIIGYEHTPPQIALETAVQSFEVLARDVLNIRLSARVEAFQRDLIHPVHQQLRVYGFEVLS